MQGLLKSEKILILCLLLAGAFLRLYAPLQYPYAINQDELNNIYDGWSIAQTGQDRWQTPNPFILRGLGEEDYRPAMQAWIIAGVFKITGYSVAVGRSVNALLGVLSLWLLFLFLKNSFNKQVAIAGLAVASLSAWHVLYSRMAHEGAVLPFFFTILILYLWQKARAVNYSRHWQVLLLAFTVGLWANAYQATKVSSLLTAIIIFGDILFKSDKKLKPLVLLVAGCFIGALSQLYTLSINPYAFFSRAKSQSVPFESFNSIVTVLKNLWLNITPEYLFFSSGTHNNLSIYRLYPAEILFFYFGLVICVINYKKLNTRFPLGFIAFATFGAILPAALTWSNPNALRASGFVIMAPVFTALGWNFFTTLFKNPMTKHLVSVAGLIIIAVSCIFTTISYHNSEDLRGRNQQHYLVELYSHLKPYKDKYDHIYIENTTGESYLYLVAFLPVEPKDFQKMEKGFAKYSFDDFYKLDKYQFIKPENWQPVLDNIGGVGKTLVAAQKKMQGCNLIDSVTWQNTTFYFMEPASQTSSKAE